MLELRSAESLFPGERDLQSDHGSVISQARSRGVYNSMGCVWENSSRIPRARAWGPARWGPRGSSAVGFAACNWRWLNPRRSAARLSAAVLASVRRDVGVGRRARGIGVMLEAHHLH